MSDADVDASYRPLLSSDPESTYTGGTGPPETDAVFTLTPDSPPALLPPSPSSAFATFAALPNGTGQSPLLAERHAADQKSDTTTVFVRRLSRKNSQKKNGSLQTFAITKVTDDEGEKKGLSASRSAGSNLPAFAELSNEADRSPTPVDSVGKYFRQPALRKQPYPSSKYSHLRTGLQRIHSLVEQQQQPSYPPLQPDGKVVLQIDDDVSTATVENLAQSPTDNNSRRSSLKNTLQSLKSDVVDVLKNGDQFHFSVKHLRAVAKRGRLFAKRKTFRLVHQTGECNIQYVNVDKRGARFLLDIFTTLVALQWRYNILIYLFSFVLSWLAFGVVWWALHVAYGTDEDGTACVVGVHDFTTAFLYSLETQHTIGYGSRYITDRCPPAICILIVQSVFGAVMQCIVTGIVFAKLARPNRRAETVMFSKKAVICLEPDGNLCLEFRVGDMRNSQLIGVNINTVLVRKTMNPQRKTIHLHQECLETTTESRHNNGFYFLAWPIKVMHRIDEKSPFWNLSPEELLVADFELVVVLEATCEATGATIQVRTSYLPSEILWGHSLVCLVTYQKDNGLFKVDYSQFHEVMPVDTPEVSASDVAKNKHKFQYKTNSVEFLDETIDCTTANSGPASPAELQSP